MRVHILPSVFVIQDKLSERDFVEKLWPLFRDILHHRESHDTLILLLDNMSLILTKLSKNEIQQELAPSVMSLLDSTHPYILQRSLKTIYGLMTQMDYSTIKSRLFPKLQAVYHASNNVAVRVHVLTCIRGTLPHLDQYTISGKVLPMLKENRPNNPLIYLACFTVYEDLSLNYLTKETIANEILPELWKMALSSAFTVNQFNQAMEVIKKLSKKLEEDQRQYLMEISKSESSKSASSQPSDLRSHNAAQVEFEALIRSPGDIGRKSIDMSQNSTIPPQLPPRRISTPNAVIKQIDALAQKSLDLNLNSTLKPKSQEPVPLWSQNNSMRRDGSNASLNEFDPMFK
jgi:SCY1-like protein 2